MKVIANGGAEATWLMLKLLNWPSAWLEQVRVEVGGSIRFAGNPHRRCFFPID
jgi:hypothetical protein